MTKYDQPIMYPHLDQDEILDLFVHDQEFAMLWFNLVGTPGRTHSMPIEQHRRVVGALRDYLTLMSNMLACTEMLLEHVE